MTKKVLKTNEGEVSLKEAAVSRSGLAEERRAGRRKIAAGVLNPVEGVDYDMLPRQLGFWVRRAQLAVMRSYEEHMRELNLRPVETGAILILHGNPDMSQVALAAALGSDQSTMVAISTKLEKRNLIERKRALKDRRYQLIRLTPDGEKMASEIRRLLVSHDKWLTRNLSNEQRNQLLNLLMQIVD